MYIVGIDIGGTAIKCGLIDNGKVVAKEFVKTEPHDVMNGVKKAFGLLLEKNKISPKDVEKIGVGVPGIIDNGVVLHSANLDLANVDIKKEMAKITGIPCETRNDGDMATLAEYNFGAGVGTKNMLMLTLGTGVGGGIIIDGKLYNANGSSELGHIPFVYGGEKCGCGGSGCVERYISCSALIRLANKYMDSKATSLKGIQNLQVSDIDSAFVSGDSVAIDVVEDYTSKLAVALSGYCNMFRPEMIVIGGGMTHAPHIVDRAIEKLASLNYGYKNAPKVKVTLAKLGNLAGILGAVI